MTRCRWNRAEVTIVGAVAGLGVALLLPSFPGFAVGDLSRDRENARRSACQSNLRQIALAIKQYNSDYDESYPLVTGGTSNHDYGWVTAVFPYTRSLQLFQCPSDPYRSGTNSRKPRYTDYWYNRNLSRVNESAITFLNDTLLLGDGDGGYKTSNARYAINSLPSGWLKAVKTPAKRHLGGANYAYTDGHVKWLKPHKVTTRVPSGSSNTFRYK